MLIVGDMTLLCQRANCNGDPRPRVADSI